MQLKMLQAKLHAVRVTHADPDYEGSCGIDSDLIAAAGLRPHQHIDIYNVSNGERFSTYIIRGAAGSGEISLNGAAARKAMVGDALIICAYALYEESELSAYQPVIVIVGEGNRIKSVTRR